MSDLRRISAQRLLSVAEMRHVIRGDGIRTLPILIPSRAGRIVRYLDQVRGHPGAAIDADLGGASAGDLLADDELIPASRGTLPPDIIARLWRVEAISTCTQCGGIECFSCVARMDHSRCRRDCTACCAW